MNQPSGVPEEPEELALGQPDRPARPRRRGAAKKPFALDIETVPQRRFWGGAEEYEIDRYWRERQQWPPEGTDLEATERLSRLTGEAPMQLTGQLPACHPTTAHVVSCSFARVDEAEEIQVETTQLDDHVDTGHAWKGPFNGDPERSIESLSTESFRRAEFKVIRRAFQLLEWATQNGRTIVTFNGKQFDLPMLRWRATLLGLEIPKFNWYEMLYPYRHKEHIDLRLLFSDGDKRAHGTLAMWCAAYGIEAEEHGGDVFDWCLRGNWDDLRKYSGDDAVSTIKLFQAIEGTL